MTEKKMTQFFELAPNGIICIDIENKQFLSVNHKFEQITGYTRSELESSHIEVLFPNGFIDNIISKFKHNTSVPYIKSQILTKTKTKKTLILSGSLIKQNNKHFLWIIVQDQTKIIKERDELIGYKKFFSLNEDIMGVLSKDGNFIKINDKVPKILGYSKDYLLSVPFLKLFHPKDLERTNRAFQNVSEGKIMINFKSRILTQNNEEKYFLFSSVFDKSTSQVYAVAKDVTEAERTQNKINQIHAEIKEQEYKYRQLFNKSGDAILIIKNGIFVDCNLAALKLFRANKKSYFIGASPLKIAPDVQPNGMPSKHKIKQMLDVVIQKGVNKFECNYIRKNGEIFPVAVFLTVINNNKNEEAVIHCILRDLTKEKENSLALKEQLRRNKRLISTTLDGYILTTESGEIVEVNKSYAKMIGYSEKEILSKNINNIELTMSPILLKQRREEVQKNGKVKFESKHVCKNGEILYVEASLAQIEIKNKTTHTAYFIRDITRRKKAELRRNIYNNISQQLNSKISVINFCEFIEKELKKILKLSFIYVSLFDTKNRHLTSIYICDETMKPHENINRKNGNGLCEYVIKKKQLLSLKSKEINDFVKRNNLTKYHYSNKHWIGIPLMSENKAIGIIEVGSNEDLFKCCELDFEVLKFIGVQLGRLISRKETAHNLKVLNGTLEEQVNLRTYELEKAKAELSKSLQKEKELGNLKSKFVSTASHQFRTPLTVIQTSLGVLELQKSKMDKDFENSFSKITERIKNQISRMTTMMDDLLTIGKINENGVDFQPNDTDVVLLVNKIAEYYNSIQVDSRKLNIIINGEKEDIYIDPKLMEHALSALISNAFKYSQGFQSPEVIISFYTHYTEFIVKDYGVGIASKDVELIFEPFFRASNALNIEGTGLGTTIIKEYLEINNGTIQIKSELNKGTEFIIQISK